MSTPVKILAMARLLMLLVCAAFLHLVAGLAIRKDGGGGDDNSPSDNDNCDDTPLSGALLTTIDIDRFS